MAVAQVRTPKYINYLLSPSTPLDFHINVGNLVEEIPPERIGAVKWMLIARSNVFRVMLLEGKMKETTEFSIKDVDPKTFKSLLTYMYGHDNTSALPFEESVKLLKAADQFDVEDLKETMASQVQEQVSADNVFTVLQYPQACEQVAPLWEKTTKIIQRNTADVFANCQFVDLSLQAMQFILQQDCLAVEEIDIWRAALRWARHQGQLPDEANPQAMRDLVLPLLKHIRLCTLTLEDLHYEVFTTSVLTYEEVKFICLSMKKQQKLEHVTSVCNEIVKRNLLGVSSYKNPGIKVIDWVNLETTFWIKMLSKIQLLSIVCEAIPKPQTCSEMDATYQCECEVKIFLIDHISSTSSGPPVATVNFNQHVRYDQEFEIPVGLENRGVMMSPGLTYAVDISFPAIIHPDYYFESETNYTDNTEHFQIIYTRPTFEYFAASHMKMFKYRVL